METHMLPIIKRIVLIILPVFLLLFATEQANAQVNVVVNPNGSFEQSEVTTSGDTTSIEGWNFFVRDNASGTYAIIDSVAKDGNRSLAITIDGSGTEDWSLEAVNEPYILNSDYTYTLTLWAKASEAGATANFTVGEPAPDYNELGRIGTADVSLSTEWQEFSFNFTVPSGADTARTPLHFSFASNVGKTIYIDNVRITYPKIIGVPLIVEAESGTVGSEWNTETDDDDGSTYVTITTDHSETTGTASNPGENRTISYEITFPDTGSYDLFARIYVGSATFDDDSWFIPQGFGEQNPDSASHWLISNGLAAAGFNAPEAVVRGAGGLGEGTWKWVNFSKNGYQGAPADTFVVSDPDSLSRIFQIGARENGLRIDKIAFGLSSYYYTVQNLDNGEVGSPTDPTEEPEPQDPIAQGKAKWLGNVYSSAQIDGFTNYWNQVTPENAGKWGSVEGTRDQMNWGELDEAYNLAKDNGFPFRFHILTWGGQQPDWINDLTTEEQLEEIEEWYDAVAERYPDLDYVEVVNEGSNGHQLPDGQSGDADYIDALGGTGETGHDWIISAFEMARERFPAAKLMINDYGIVGNISATNVYLRIIEDLQERNLIDVIGVQSHAFSTGSASADLRRTLNMLGETGLLIQATEMDIDGNPNGTEAESDAAQLARYQRIFPVYWEHPSVEGITLWGWRTGLWRQDQDAFLVRNNGEERPALEWLRAYVDTAQVVIVSNEEPLTNKPTQFRLYENYPNPFNPTTQIKYDVPQASDVKITVYDITGRIVQTLVNSQKTSGSHTVAFNASGISSGIYFYRIETSSFVKTKRMMLIK